MIDLSAVIEAAERDSLVVAFGLMVLGGLTIQRNRDYQSEIALWTDTVTLPGTLIT